MAEELHRRGLPVVLHTDDPVEVDAGIPIFPIRDAGPPMDVADSLAALTPREREVLAAMAVGESNRGIARRLFISERVVERHITAIFAKLSVRASDNVHRRVLAVLAYQQGA